MNKAILAASLLGLLASGATVTAMAGDTATDSKQVAVRYGDLNLQSAEGQEALKRRVSSAARSVCPNPYSADLVTRVSGKRCVSQAVNQAMADISERQLANAAAVKGDRS